MAMSDTPDFDTVSAVIRRRRTAKRLLDPASRTTPLSVDQAERLQAMLATAGPAPVPKRAHDVHRSPPQDSPVPWRFHVLEQADAQALNGWLEARALAEPDGRWERAWNSKIPALLAAAGALVLVTWLPDPPASGAATSTPELTLGNVEHIAAASAAVQNLLLAAEARGWYGYWSSGGVLRDPALFEHLGIDGRERLLGSIFLAPPDATFERNVPGGLREQRGPASGWARRVTLG